MIKDRYVDTVKYFGGLLLKIEKPDRYIGGETGTLADKEEKKNSVFRTLIAFPDLYEIGMGNQALKIIYNRLNKMQDILCDRAFAPAPDFEKLLREMNLPLYGLETGLVFSCFDMLMFTIGYELGLNGILLMLDVSGIPLRCERRGEEHPPIIAGGPAISNPLPFSPFIDAFWTGEAEAGFFDLAGELAQIKKSGQGRAALLEKISSHPNIWVKGKEKAVRAVYSGFSFDNTQAAVFPVPRMKIVHNHGSIEIMRGCPNGCRFCHAGFWYRPMRQKSVEQITAYVSEMISKGGWQEISLSSLSSGDYQGIDELVERLNSQFSSSHISFQMPSLKVSGFSLNLLEKISVTRKSSLTFAVETPNDARQISINKEVTRNSVFEILEEAKKRGWKTAKFYFMIGLPLPENQTNEKITEEEEIAGFIADIGRRTRMRFNINIGIFIPKAHTPFQFAAQIDSVTAQKKLDYIRFKLKPMGHKVSVSDTVISQIEGILSRGDERAGFLCERAYLEGSRLDAWDEYIDKAKWLKIFEENQSLINDILSGKDNSSENIPWKSIDSCVSKEFIENEFYKSRNYKITPKCGENCSSCGVCVNDIAVIKNNSFKDGLNTVNHNTVSKSTGFQRAHVTYKVIFSFSKKGSAVFHGHLSLIETFSFAFRRLNIPVVYSQGYNPIVKMEFASPLTTGISAQNEFVSVELAEKIEFEKYLHELNTSLPQGLNINRAEVFLIPEGKKKYSLSSLLWGFSYSSPDGNYDYVSAKGEKIYRENCLENYTDKKPALINLNRAEVLARNITGTDCEWASYFDVYRFLY